jgi:hypothetical protein
MIKNLEEYDDMLPEDVESKAKDTFVRYAKKNDYELDREEFDLFLQEFTKEQLGEENQLYSKLIEEDYFSVNLSKDEKTMPFEKFLNAFKELLILVKYNENGAEKFDLDLDIEI